MALGAPVLARQLQALHDHDPRPASIIGGQGVPASLRATPGIFYAADTEQLARHLDHGLNASLQGGPAMTSPSVWSADSEESCTTATVTDDSGDLALEIVAQQRQDRGADHRPGVGAVHGQSDLGGTP